MGRTASFISLHSEQTGSYQKAYTTKNCERTVVQLAPILLGLIDVRYLLLRLGYQSNRSESPCPLVGLSVIDSHPWLGVMLMDFPYFKNSNLDLTPTTGSHDNGKQEWKKQFPFLHNYIIHGLMASASPNFLHLFWNNIKKNCKQRTMDS